MSEKEDNGVRLDEETGKIHIDLAKLPDFSMEQLLMADGIFTAGIAARIPEIRSFHETLATNVAALSENDDLIADIRRTAELAVVPEKDEQGFLMGTLMEKVKELQARTEAHYEAVSQVAGTDEICVEIAQKIQQFYHPDTPFEPKSAASPEM